MKQHKLPKLSVYYSEEVHYLESYIKRNSNDTEGIRLLFNTIIVNKFTDFRLDFFKLFLEHNKSIELFQSLDFHENVGSYSGSIIPIIEGKIQFMYEVKNLLNSFKNSSVYIKHKLFIKRKIQHLRDDISRARKREFEGLYSF